MTRAAPRSAAERKADTLAKLHTPAIDAWVASASVSDGGSPQAHLVPLSLAWIDERVVIALESGSRTARNVVEHGIAVSIHPLAEPEYPFDPLAAARGDRAATATAHRPW